MGEDKGNNIKLKSILSLVRNKKNQQYSFIIKKRMFNAFNLTPSNILDMTIPRKFDKQKKIKIKITKPIKYSK